ncbi:hypothetical protein CRUP_013607, partial [Coryphaenoides rupestris]
MHLQVHLTYIYPNDYTRLTHMETENSCFYHESGETLKRFGFLRYMRMDRPERPEKNDRFRDFPVQRRDADWVPDEEEVRQNPPKAADNALSVDYSDDDNDGGDDRRRGRRLLSRGEEEREPRGGIVAQNGSDPDLHAAVGVKEDGASLRARPLVE